MAGGTLWRVNGACGRSGRIALSGLTHYRCKGHGAAIGTRPAALFPNPTPEVAAEQFTDVPDPAGKLRRFIDISCRCYERAADWRAAERRHLPAFARTLAREEAALDAIVRGLLKPAGAARSTIAAVKTLVDFPFWQALIANGTPMVAAPAGMTSGEGD